MGFICRASALFAIGLLALSGEPLQAQLNGNNSLGDFGVLSATQPAPGFYASAFYYRYDSGGVLDAAGEEISFAPGSDPGRLAINAFAPILWWVTEKKIFGANYGLMAVIPIANWELEAPVFGTDLRTRWGLGDLYLQPVNLGWHRERADFMAGLALTLPTGRYADTDEGDIGLGHWAFEVYAGSSVYFDQAKRWHLATTAFWETHSAKKDSDTTVGDLLTLEGGLGRSFKAGALIVGASYFAQWKLTADDFGRDFTVPGGLSIGNHRVYGIGPEVTLPLASSQRLLALVTVRYLWEFGARTKSQGQTFVLTATFPIPSVPLS